MDEEFFFPFFIGVVIGFLICLVGGLMIDDTENNNRVCKQAYGDNSGYLKQEYEDGKNILFCGDKEGNIKKI